MLKFALATIMALAITVPANAEDAPIYIHCTAQATGNSPIKERIEVHYRINSDHLYRFSEGNNRFWTPCVNRGFQCSFKITDTTIMQKQFHAFKMAGEDSYFEKTIYISRYTGSYSEWTDRLTFSGKLDETISSYAGSCITEDSPEKSSRKF